jgi:hypothetical protein
MPTGMRMVGLPRELLFIVCRRQKENQTLAKNGPTVGKRGGL